MGKLDGKVAFVTGASRGIGAAAARAMAAEGARLGLASRSGDDLGLAGAVAGSCDVRDEGQVRSLVNRTVEAFGHLDILVANAGIGAYGSFLDLDPQDVEDMIDINVRGLLYTVRAALPHLVAGGEGDVVTIASEAGRRGLPGETVYCATKFAQVGFTRSLDHELRERGIRCTALCPGGVATDFAMGKGRRAGMPELAGMMTPEDVAEAVLFAVTRPRNHRILEMAFRHMAEASWG